MSVKIHCPKCGRVLGDTDKSVDGLRINCHGCKAAVTIDLVMPEMGFYDFLAKKEKEDDKSK